MHWTRLDGRRASFLCDSRGTSSKSRLLYRPIGPMTLPYTGAWGPLKSTHSSCFPLSRPGNWGIWLQLCV